jgi:hypothetical protein
MKQCIFCGTIYGVFISFVYFVILLAANKTKPFWDFCEKSRKTSKKKKKILNKQYIDWYLDIIIYGPVLILRTYYNKNQANIYIYIYICN